MLDLGVWVAIQHQVDSYHRLQVMHKDELAKSVERAYLTVSPKILEKIHLRWKMVLHLIKAGKGTNELVEAHRGELNRNVTEAEKLPTVPDILGYTSDDGDEDSVYYDEGDILDNRAEGHIPF